MDIFNALAEPRRRKIVEIIASHGKLTAGEIYTKFTVTPQAISQHLHILHDAKLLNMEKRSQQHIYSINAVSLQDIEQWVNRIGTLWNESLDRLEKVVEEEKRKQEV